MKGGVRRGAKARGGAGIRGDFRFDEDDVHTKLSAISCELSGFF